MTPIIIQITMGKARRVCFLILGYLFLGLGIAGRIVPGLPSTIFVILALACFRRGSERMANWLLNLRGFGPMLRDWDQYGSIKRRSKVIAVSMMWFFVMLSLWKISLLWVQATVAVAAIIGTWYILSRPSTEDVKVADETRIPATEAA